MKVVYTYEDIHDISGTNKTSCYNGIYESDEEAIYRYFRYLWWSRREYKNKIVSIELFRDDIPIAIIFPSHIVRFGI